jgi:hypothetical protein
MNFRQVSPTARTATITTTIPQPWRGCIRDREVARQRKTTPVPMIATQRRSPISGNIVGLGAGPFGVLSGSCHIGSFESGTAFSPSAAHLFKKGTRKTSVIDGGTTRYCRFHHRQFCGIKQACLVLIDANRAGGAANCPRGPVKWRTPALTKRGADTGSQ